MNYKTNHLNFENVDSIPKNKVGLLLGTGKYVASGNINLFYLYRIDATVALYNAGKIEYVLVSGD
ncbi:MAG: vancomycin high temperature exclusion protein, partial [Winogradskyella sp.]|nr:vancomycin high temperature exclusion protein [Winogradskyella sp.]